MAAEPFGAVAVAVAVAIVVIPVAVHREDPLAWTAARIASRAGK